MPKSSSAKASVNMKLCVPFGNASPVNGLDEYFDPIHYENSLSFLICSPWLEKTPFKYLESLLPKNGSHQHRFYVLTFRDHKKRYLDELIETFRSIRNRQDVAQFSVGFLPTEHNPYKFAPDVLHTKMYVLAKNAPDVNSIQKTDILEAFFGSANFTSKGIGGAEIGLQHEEHGSQHKFELVARVQDDEGKHSVYSFFKQLWRYCDEQHLGVTYQPDQWHMSQEKRQKTKLFSRR